ncbi:hypothetical protein FACS1894104_5080 [Actinomycetota bacterium]|nr:hypothetical protein FACS1894104_5080 [Actinomycetota bacterium]
MSALTLVAPVTSTNNHFPLHVKIRKGNCIDGFVQCEAIRAIDLDVREQSGATQHVGAIDDITMQDIMSRILVVVGAD